MRRQKISKWDARASHVWLKCHSFLPQSDQRRVTEPFFVLVRKSPFLAVELSGPGLWVSGMLGFGAVRGSMRELADESDSCCRAGWMLGK
jgi:hypothetical protein